MKTHTLTATVAICILVTVGSAFAASTPVPTGDAHVSGPNTSSSHVPAPVGDVQGVRPPASVGKCKTDAVLRQKCIGAYDRCVRQAAAHPKCKEHWATCCAAVSPDSNHPGGAN
jgi:hypothetical protein